MVERMASFKDLPIADIVVPNDRLRPISEAKVVALMVVIEQSVYLGAITVRRVGKVNILIDGAHRLEAMRRLGREIINADVLDCTAGEARRMEITGNILAGMTPIQDAIFLGVYQVEYEKLHPETKRGTVGAMAKHGLQQQNSSFAELIAETRQITPRRVRQIVAAGRYLSVEERAALQAASHRIPLDDIEKLGKMQFEADRAAVVAGLLAGKSASETIRAQKALKAGVQPTLKDPVDTAFLALTALWSRVPKGAKRRFVDELAQELAALLNGRDQ